MNEGGFAYFLNAVHYCIWLNDIRFGEFNERIAHYLLNPILNLFFTKEWRERYYERAADSQKDLRNFFYDKKRGFHIKWANHWFGYIYSCYPSFLSFIMFGFILKTYGDVTPFAMIGTLAVPIGLGYIPAYRAVFSNDRYLGYFKEFEKESKEWHRKWKRITRAFCVGGFLITLLSIAAVWIILLW